MATGEYSIDISTGTYEVTASKEGCISQTVEGVEVLEGKTTEVNFKLGGEKMGTYTEPIVVMDGSTKTINVPIAEPTLLVKFLDIGTPMVGKTVELLTEDGATVLQTQTTDAEGIATFTNVLHGNYKVRISY